LIMFWIAAALLMVFLVVAAVAIPVVALIATITVSFFFYYKIASQVIPRTEKNKTSVYIIKGFILQAASAVLFIVPTILFQLTDISGTVKLITWIIGGIVTLAAIPFVLHKFRYLNVEQYVKIFYGSLICAGIVGPSTGLLVCELMRLLAIMAL